MATCDLVKLDELTLPAVNGVQMRPQHLTDSERTISGMLRTDHTATAREWQVNLRGVPGVDADALTAFLLSPAPRVAEVMGGPPVTVMVRLDGVTHRPRIISARPDLGRVDMALTLTEVTPLAPVVVP